jgi:hypothetical protein
MDDVAEVTSLPKATRLHGGKRQRQPLGPYSRPAALANFDGRSRDGRFMRRVRADLTAHVGGKPSAAQRAIIDRIAWLHLHIAMIDARSSERRGMTDCDARTYLAWTNTLARMLGRLGLKGAAAEPRNLRDTYAATTR